ncbi:MAG: MarR family transcriptional regulator [Chloroflexi bacterium]|nr:MarR family transcriptional regulator [Chloroflexota bacterium]
MAAWQRFLRAHARVTELLERELAAEQGLPLGWYDVLVQLSNAGGRLRMHDLARAVLLSRAGLTRLVDRMAAAGLAGREPCADDRRGTFVTLTPAGQERLRAAAPVHLRGVQEHFARHISPGEAHEMSAVFDRILAAIESRH